MTVSQSEYVTKKILDHYFFAFRKMDNYRPPWLGGLELDRLYPDMGVAIEFQGRQHFLQVPEMGNTYADLHKQISNDQKKRILVEGHGIKLFALDLYDLTPERIKRYSQQITQIGLTYARNKGFKEVVQKLGNIRFDKDPDESLFKSASRLLRGGRVKPPKKPWWKKILGA